MALPIYHDDYRNRATRAQQREFLGRVGLNVGKAVWSDVKRIGKAYGVPIMVGGVRQAVGAAAGSAFNTPPRMKPERNFTPPPPAKKAKKNIINSKPKAMSTPDLSKASAVTLKRTIQQISSDVESSDDKRCPPANYRLHPAKYVTGLPALFKDMFMPTLTSKLSFGFVSNNGFNTNVYGEGDGALGQGITVSHQAPRGQWRGIALFKCRFTDPLVTRESADALNALKVGNGVKIGTAPGTSSEVETPYRRFNSNPYSSSTSGSATDVIDQSVCQTIVATPINDNSELRQLGVGANLCHFEDHAYQASNFVQSIASQSIGTAGNYDTINDELNLPALSETGGNTGTTNMTMGATNYNWNGKVPLIQGQYYPPNVRDMVMRISDGFIEMDISNTSKTPAVIEIVLHSCKKTSFQTGTQDVYNEIYNSYDYYAKQATGTNNSTSTKCGGWQTFYDPEVPMLKVPSKHAGKVKDIVNEVHRSNHVLASGQSKVVKIALGGLYYKLGHKSEFDTQNTSGYIHNKIDNAGTILCAIGHTGFKGFESMGSSNMYDLLGDPLPNGGGFWAGKTYTPSSIAVSGRYQEQYYPMYAYTTGRVLGNHYPLIGASAGNKHGLPINVLTTQHITTTDDGQLGRPTGSVATQTGT